VRLGGGRVLEGFRFAANCNRFFNEIALGQFFTSSASLALAMFQLTLVSFGLVLRRNF
jgi:hypothetical protein